MYCRHCGNRMNPGDRVCGRCGAPWPRANSAPWIAGIICAAIALAAVIALILLAPGSAKNASSGGSSPVAQIVGTWQLTSYENETGKTDMTVSNVQYTFFDNGTMNTSEGNVSTTQGAHWEWVDQNKIAISFENGDVILDITFGKTDGKDSFTAVVIYPDDPNKDEILTFVKTAQSADAEGGGQGEQTTQGSLQETNGVSIGDMSLQELQGEWSGTGILTSLENIEKYIWNWEVLPADEVALYNGMVGVENECRFEIDQDNDVGCEVFSSDPYWRGFGVSGMNTGTTLADGQLSASAEFGESYEMQLYAVLSIDSDGVMMLQGTMQAVIREGPLGGPYDEIPYTFTFTVKKLD